MEANSRDKAIAAANLSQLTLFVNPGEIGAFAVLPNGNAAKDTILHSLEALGFNTADVSEKREVAVVGFPPEHNLFLSMREGMELGFNEAGVKRLIENGVSSPALDALKGRTPGAFRR